MGGVFVFRAEGCARFDEDLNHGRIVVLGRKVEGPVAFREGKVCDSGAALQQGDHFVGLTGNDESAKGGLLDVSLDLRPTWEPIGASEGELSVGKGIEFLRILELFGSLF